MFCEEHEAVSMELRKLTASHQVKGKRIHDANVVATMLAHGVSKLITASAGDFEGFPELQIIGLDALAGGVPRASAGD